MISHEDVKTIQKVKFYVYEVIILLYQLTMDK